MTLTFDTRLELSQWSCKHPLNTEIKVVDGRKYEVRKKNKDQTSCTYQLYKLIKLGQKTFLKLRSEFDIRDEAPNSLELENNQSFTNIYGNQRLTSISFSQDSQEAFKFKKKEMIALMLLAFKHSMLVGNEGRLCIMGHNSTEKLFSKFLKKIPQSNMTETFYMYLPHENVAAFEQEMNLSIKKIKLLDDKNHDCGMLWILVGVTMVFFWNMSLEY